jgi:hypothetical protein
MISVPPALQKLHLAPRGLLTFWSLITLYVADHSAYMIGR